VQFENNCTTAWRRGGTCVNRAKNRLRRVKRSRSSRKRKTLGKTMRKEEKQERPLSLDRILIHEEGGDHSPMSKESG